MSALSTFIGVIGIFVWLFLFASLYFFRIHVDRFLTKGNYLHIFILLILICIMPFSISVVASCFDIKPYDLLYDDNLYGRGSDLEAKLEYRNNILDRINEEVDDPSLEGTVYYHFRGFGDIYSAGTPKGRRWAFAIGAIGLIVFGGLVIPMVLQVVSRRSTNYLEGLSRYDIQKSPFAVIFGAHETTAEIIHRIFSKDHRQKIKYVILLTDTSVKKYRHELESQLSTYEKDHLLIYGGSRVNPSEIKQLHLERAKEVYVLGESSSLETDSDHDSMNMECIRLMAENLRDMKRKTPLLCFTLFDYQTTFKAFFYSDLSNIVKEQIEFVYINYYSLWAQNVLTSPQSADESRVKYLPLEGSEKLDKDSSKYVHLVIVGMTKMGTALANEAAYITHYPNFCSKHIRTKITFIDPNAETESRYVLDNTKNMFELCRWRKVDMEKQMPDDVEWNDALKTMAEMKRAGKELPFEDYPYSHLADPDAEDPNFIDVEWEFLAGSTNTENVKKYLKQCANDENQLLTVAICHKHSQEAIATSLSLPIDIYRYAVQVLVYQKKSSDIINNISGKYVESEFQSLMRYQKLRPFGMLSECFSKQIVDNRLAKLVNYVYYNKKDFKLSCADEIEPGTRLSRKDILWRNCLVANQMSNIYNSISITTKLRFLGFDFRTSPVVKMLDALRVKENLDILTEVEHNRWVTEKLMMGFRPVNNKEVAPLLEIIKNGGKTTEFLNEKNELKKGWEMAHLNICSFATLKKYDSPSVEYDVVMTKAFPALVEWMREEL